MENLKDHEGKDTQTPDSPTLDDLINSMAAGGEDSEQVGQKRSLTAQPIRFWQPQPSPVLNAALSQESVEEHRQRDTPTTQEIEALFADECSGSKKKKKSKTEEYNEAVQAALQSGILTQLSPPLSWGSSTSSSPRTPKESQISITRDATEKRQTLMDLVREEDTLVRALQRKGSSLSERCEIVNRLQINLEKQSAIVADEAEIISTQSSSHSPSF